ncbi:L-asparaginase [Draconibacterium orientale]|uniref:asparaginase n=1 Tax=Draconibacterium orientale TaxID=1168034 RepID=X5D8Y6_9BACT|nr:asparaginase [Draconibacterium orientale]AHW59218.1 1-alkyl-2-acetylglycerophosphocholine esterase [Draconibacterium orientale]SET23633.1 L-asparaginase [Draconibacterium orientale]
MTTRAAKKTSILIIYTGGTIGMVQDPKNGALKPVKFDKIQEVVPELKKFDFIIKTITFNPALDSSNMNPITWIKIAKTIERHYNAYDGFVILHGTDTMAYTASALSYMFENLDKPIILTGSQLPIGMIRTDGKENLITAVEIAAAKIQGLSIVPEVCIYFDFKLYRGNRTLKRDAELFSAFRSVNYPELAVAGIDIKFSTEFIYYPENKGILKVNTDFDDNVVILKIFPGINQNVFNSVLNTPGLKGVVLETFGSGNVPTSRWLINAIKRTIKRGIVVLNVTQCQGGKVVMGQYQTSVELLNAGVVSAKDMTTEAAITKLMFLLGQSLKPDEIKMYLNKSLRGEISE